MFSDASSWSKASLLFCHFLRGGLGIPEDLIIISLGPAYQADGDVVLQGLGFHFFVKLCENFLFENFMHRVGRTFISSSPLCSTSWDVAYTG